MFLLLSISANYFFYLGLFLEDIGSAEPFTAKGQLLIPPSALLQRLIGEESSAVQNSDNKRENENCAFRDGWCVPHKQFLFVHFFTCIVKFKMIASRN